MGETDDAITKVIVLGIAVVLGILLFAQMVVPIVIDTVGDLTGDYNRYLPVILLIVCGVAGSAGVVVGKRKKKQ